MEDDFTAQAKRFVRSAAFCVVTLGLAFEGGVFGVLGVAVTLGFAFQGVASKKLCFRDKSQLKWRFWWMGRRLDVGISWPVKGIMRSRVVVEVYVAVTLGLACERVLFGGTEIAKLLGRAA